MKPDRASFSGFLGLSESLLEVLANDNVTVINNGFTHQQLANFLFHFDQSSDQTQPESHTPVTINHIKFAHRSTAWRGFQESPFNDNIATNKDHLVVNLETGAGVNYSGLLPEMIHRYGFYEGKDTIYRLDPLDIAKTAGLVVPIPQDDSIVRLIQNENASVTITTQEQIKRIGNLLEVNHNILQGSNFQIKPENLDTLTELSKLISNPNLNRNLEQKLDIQRLISIINTDNISPVNYQIENQDFRFFTEIVPASFPELNGHFLNSIENIILPMQSNDHDINLLVGLFLQTIIEEVGSNNEQNNLYFKQLLNKISITEDTAHLIFNQANKLHASSIHSSTFDINGKFISETTTYPYRDKAIAFAKIVDNEILEINNFFTKTFIQMLGGE
jgi:hypothetical protein